MGPRATFERDGFVILRQLVPVDALASARQELEVEFPSADDFHDDVNPVRNERFRDEFNGISNFPFNSVELSLLAVHDHLIGVAEELLQTRELRVYSIEAWAKYTARPRTNSRTTATT